MSDKGENCPLCAEEMDLTDLQLKPCKCGYEICVWCWHHLMEMAEKDGTVGRCPACRTPYDKEKIVGMAAKCDRVVAEPHMEKKRSQKTRSKSAEGRKQLSSTRVIQRNLVYIVGLPLHLADEDLLQHKEYFGQYGKVLKVTLSRTAAGVIQQFPNDTCSVFITYSKVEEAISCIQSVHGFTLEGRPLRACFGTTKYCYAWLRNVPCTNAHCVYLHEIGSPEDSFTKDEEKSAYTRVQKITGLVYNTKRRSGTVLPPPLDASTVSKDQVPESSDGDESITSPQNMAQLLGESDGDSGSLCRMSSSRKVQNDNQSRFSFARQEEPKSQSPRQEEPKSQSPRQEEPKSQSLDDDHLFNVFGQLSTTNTYGSNSSGILIDNSTVAKSFTSNSFMESNNFNSMAVSSNNFPASTASMLFPPGFSVPSQAPPPDFASHERLKHAYDTAYGGNRVLDASSVLRNSYQPHTGSTGNANDLDFYDPAILQVVESGVQSVPKNSVSDVRASYHQQFNNALANEARLKLLMQISTSQPQNLRYSDTKDSYSVVNSSYGIPSSFLNQPQVNLSNSYGIPSRLDQSQLDNISLFGQPQLQQSRNSLMASGQWNEVQGGNNLSIAELLRDGTLGYEKIFPSYEDKKFSMPSSGEFCNRTFWL